MEKLKTVGKAVLEMEQSFFSLDQIVKNTGMRRREVCHILEKLYLEKIILKVLNKKREEYQGTKRAALLRYHLPSRQKRNSL